MKLQVQKYVKDVVDVLLVFVVRVGLIGVCCGREGYHLENILHILHTLHTLLAEYFQAVTEVEFEVRLPFHSLRRLPIPKYTCAWSWRML